MSDLERRLQDAAGPPTAFPTEAVRSRVHRRRRVRAASSLVAVLALAVSVGMAVLPRGPASDLQVGSGPAAETVDISPDDTPTRLPADYRRCGPVTHDRDVTVQTFCAPEARDLVLRFGPHDRLPELGQQHGRVRDRPVFVGTVDDRRLVTISDRTSSDDRHYRVEAPARLSTDTLVDVVRSIPAFTAATSAP